MPLWAGLLVAVTVLLAAMWIHDRRVRRRGARLNDPSAMARGVSAPQGNPETHRNGMPGHLGGGPF